MRTSKAHSADRMRLSFSEVLGTQRSTAVSTNTDGRLSVTSQGAYKAVHQNAVISGALFPRLVQCGFHHCRRYTFIAVLLRCLEGRHRRPVVPPAFGVLLAADDVSGTSRHNAAQRVCRRPTPRLFVGGIPLLVGRYATFDTNWATQPLDLATSRAQPPIRRKHRGEED